MSLKVDHVHVGNQDRAREAEREKSYWSSTGWPTGAGLDGYYDGQSAQPNAAALVKAYNDIVFANVNLIASKVADVPIRLYVATHTGQQRPKCATAPLTHKNFHVRRKQLGAQVQEVVNHPALDLLRRCNSVHSKKDLIGNTQIFLDVAGNAFWLLRYNPAGFPCQIFLLPSQHVQPQRDANQMVTAWVVGQGPEQSTYLTKDVVHFKEWNPSDLYGLGMSPVQAAWARIQLGRKELKYLDATLTNQGRPDTVIAIKDSMNPVEAERLQKEWYTRYSQGLNGGPLVVDGTMSVAPLSYPPADLAELELYKVIKTSICNCLGVPPELWELGTSNRATADAVLFSLAENCLKPRVNRLVETLNERLLPYFDDTGRLFFEADSVVPADREHDLAEAQMLLASQVITRSEARIIFGFTPEPWADEPLLPSGVMPIDAFDQQDAPAPAPAPEPPVDRAQYAAGLANVQVTYYAGQIPRDAAVALVISTYGYSPKEAQSLFPDVPPEPPKPETPPPAPAPEPTPPPPEKAKSVDVPDDRQDTTYDCGPAAVMSVCQHFGLDVGTEQDLIARLGTTPENGTSPEAICAYLTDLGLDVSPRQGMTLEDLATSTDQNSPVICCVQAYGTPGEEQASQSGHYVVVTGVSDQAVSIQDPSAGAKDVPLAEWDASWHDHGGGTDYQHYGIAVSDANAKGNDDCVGRKIPIFMGEGMSQEQAIAAAIHYCGGT